MNVTIIHTAMPTSIRQRRSTLCDGRLVIDRGAPSGEVWMRTEELDHRYERFDPVPCRLPLLGDILFSLNVVLKSTYSRPSLLT